MIFYIGTISFFGTSSLILQLLESYVLDKKDSAGIIKARILKYTSIIGIGLILLYLFWYGC